MSADLWAGAEAQLATLASNLVQRRDVSISAVLMNDGPLATRLRGLGIDVAVVDEHRHNALAILRFVTRFLKERNVNLVHTHRYKDTVISALAVRLSGTPHLVRTVHGLTEPTTGWARVKLMLYEALDQAALRWAADRVITVSKEMAATLSLRGYRNSSLIAIHNGIDLDLVRPSCPGADVRAELGIDARATVIGTVGRLVPVKGHETFLRAARRIADALPHTQFLIAGDGPLRQDLESLAAEVGVSSRCRFLGARHDVYDVMAAMDIVVLPSKHEGIPMALLEAMALQKPVIVTAVGGMPEVVKHHINGVLVQPGDDAGIAGACVELARDRKRALTLAAAARQTVEQTFSHHANAAAVYQTYRHVAGDDPLEPCRAQGPADLSTVDLARALVQVPFGIAIRKFRRAIVAATERRRMSRLRRHPEPLVSALRSAKQVLIVCQGNIIRSPYAAHMLRRSLSQRARISVVSGGLSAVSGNPAHPTALRMAGERDIDLSAHAASPLTRDGVDEAEVIFVMEIGHLLLMHERFPESRGKTFLLTCLAADAALEIRDPVDGDDPRFHLCFEHISQALGPIVGALTGISVPR